MCVLFLMKDSGLRDKCKTELHFLKISMAVEKIIIDVLYIIHDYVSGLESLTMFRLEKTWISCVWKSRTKMWLFLQFQSQIRSMFIVLSGLFQCHLNIVHTHLKTLQFVLYIREKMITEMEIFRSSFNRLHGWWQVSCYKWR